jgi:hypothetical protein
MHVRFTLVTLASPSLIYILYKYKSVLNLYIAAVSQRFIPFIPGERY